MVNILIFEGFYRLTDIENRLVVAKGEGVVGEEWIGSLGLADANYYIQDG